MTCQDFGEMRTLDTGAWTSRCGCGHVACESGTYEEAAAALEAHRTSEEGE